MTKISSEEIDIHSRRWLNKEKDDEKEHQFWMEISMLYTLKHKNLVSIVGFCDENDELITVIKFETRLSLENYLSNTLSLTWVRRLEICVGVAHALSYIHYDELRDFSVIHRNINSEIVLLNDNWEPKLSEFRLSMKIKASERHHSFHVDKEIANDTNKYLAPMAITRYREKRLQDIIDWNLRQQMDSESFNTFAETAYECLNEERSQRPNIDEIVPKLEKALKLAYENTPTNNTDTYMMMSSVNHDDFAHLEIPLENILTATNSFKNVVGGNGFVKYYKGELLLSGELINILAERLNKEWFDGERQFWMEVSLLSSLKHKNLISLVGFCDDNDEKVIIYKRETRASLNKYLSDSMMQVRAKGVFGLLICRKVHD
nr:protein kinase-like domain, phloem protein 2-like protein [Tanacetum cinerariifolium]